MKRVENALLAIEGFEQDDEKSVRFQINPEEIHDAHGADWLNNPIVGRSEPMKTWVGGTPRTFNFSIDMVSSFETGDDWSSEKMYRDIMLLQSWTRPLETTNSKFVLEPPVLTFVIGRLIVSRVVAVNIDVLWKGPWQLTDDGAIDLPMVAEIRFRLDEINAIPLSNIDYLRRRSRVPANAPDYTTGDISQTQAELQNQLGIQFYEQQYRDLHGGESQD